MVSLLLSSSSMASGLGLEELTGPDDLSMCPCRDFLERGDEVMVVVVVVCVLDFRFFSFDSDAEDDEDFLVILLVLGLDRGFCVCFDPLEALDSKSSRCDCLLLLLVVAGMMLM